MRSKFAAVTAVLLALTLSTAGCSSLNDALSDGEKLPEATVAAPDVTVSGELPENAPATLPLWPGAEVLGGSSAEEAFELMLQTSDTYDDVLAGLAVGFENEGWEIVEEPMGEGEERLTVLSVSRSDAEGVVSLTQDASDTVISYVVTPVE